MAAMKSLTLITTISLAALGFQTAMAAEKVAADVLFARKVLPLFKAKCIAWSRSTTSPTTRSKR